MARTETDRDLLDARAGRRLVVVVSAVLALDAALYSAVVPLLPVLRRDFALSDGSAGLLVATYALGLLAAALPAGWLTARIGARAAMLVSLLLFSVASAGFGLGTTVVALDVTRALQGVAAALTWTAGFAWLLAVAPKDRHGLVIGGAVSAAVAGGLAGPVLGALAAHVGRAGVFAGVAVVALTVCAIVWFLPAPRRTGDLRLSSALRALSRGGGAVGAWVVLLAGCLFGALTVLVPLQLDDLGTGPTAIGAIFVVVGVGEIALGPVVGRLSDREGARLPMLGSLAVTGALLLALAQIGSLVPMIVAVVVLLPAITAMITPAYAALGRVAEERGVAVAGLFGAGNLAWAGGEGAGALSAGWLEDAGKGDVSYFALAGLALATVVVLRSVRHGALGPRDEQVRPRSTTAAGPAS